MLVSALCFLTSLAILLLLGAPNEVALWVSLGIAIGRERLERGRRCSEAAEKECWPTATHQMPHTRPALRR